MMLTLNFLLQINEYTTYNGQLCKKLKVCHENHSATVNLYGNVMGNDEVYVNNLVTIFSLRVGKKNELNSTSSTTIEVNIGIYEE